MDNISCSVTEDDIRTKDFIVRKSVSVYHLKYGFNFLVGKRLYFDIYSGFGIRLKNIKNPNLFFDRDLHKYIETGNHDYFGTDNLESYQNEVNFNFSLGFKFGVKL
jgi:hypothetical protein